MSQAMPGDKPGLGPALPHVFVRDIEAALAYYRDRLGFRVTVTYGTPPFYAEVARDRARLAFRSVWEPVFAGDVRERESLLSASFAVDTRAAIEALFAEITAAGVALHQPLTDQPWGARDFVVRDPDGNLIHFARPQK